ncbi:Pimeloyl-ACP methyl ester carboxylesterase [Roseovarius nanhaiticus]|uniref:Palmitoyl-protein thioesterase ABHD10, mitochondrial n=1 Tax=Roseovarius nanhaiticus TaxID=573024 RepID=A0A1N7G0K0_9RHOB|nr:alpha/beta hydrolase [Roseovarius nanhaiticus]SEK40401.1 Pimeloyl-ACP methyl ester carboxylesterase [Roseovarius nanhaiticus]SIS06081.1 Pimeloyl-ACP methyl ester carboxylesterase [Roseovarius nanhaiticus]
MSADSHWAAVRGELETPERRRIAYHRTRGRAPGTVFLGGFMSDMEGTKAVHLEARARADGRAFLRFDYSGHGASSGAFTDGCISEWAADAIAVIEACTEGPQILVGSSMGGWIALLVARQMPERIAGMVTIAAAPDFTEDSMWAGLTDAQRAEVMEAGQTLLPSDYDAPYPVTRKLIEDGRQNLVLRDALHLPFPVRFLQGAADESVKTSVALSLLDHAEGPDMRLTLVDGADHRFSDAQCLELIDASIADVLERATG